MTAVHLVKLCVGAEKVEDLMAWQEMRAQATPDGLPRHVTRMWPKREAELLGSGSLYWVFKGLILARQAVLRLDEVVTQDGIRRCAIVLDRTIIRTEARPRRPFQGWRYLDPADAPPDMTARAAAEPALPPALAAALAEIGVLKLSA
ncbi:DUF1489 family protein [Mangrovicoccus algicola]|uniref:DUF1489 domain-containing protein n=1 Tax=Mangrovicoccus algicola TaxID=2771008 RepID=A0A8J6Z266_9RHOB|nr:DUF1489 domain-containing protein [Mangrovicoccus algicola]MBE3640266.1 DUF1489 domain-containing protein [Mangrovicoccus algicola]